MIDVKGFSTLPGDGLVAIDAAGTQYGDILGRPGRGPVAGGRRGMLSDARSRLETVTIAIQDKEVERDRSGVRGASRGAPAAGGQPSPPSCGNCWPSGPRSALLTRIEGAAAGPAAMVVDREGRPWGGLGPTGHRCVREAAAMLQGRAPRRPGGSRTRPGWCWSKRGFPRPASGRGRRRRTGGALDAQGALLGWDCRATDDGAELGELLDWAGATAALIVLSHDPHVDTPALIAGLARGVPYVGALGSRATQSRRLERLAAAGVDPPTWIASTGPIGLDLGGRRAPEVALSIAAEILACHRGRDARPLRDATGPINDRPGVRVARCIAARTDQPPSSRRGPVVAAPDPV